MSRGTILLFAGFLFSCAPDDGLGGLHGGNGDLPDDTADTDEPASMSPALSNETSYWEYFGEPYFSDVIWTTVEFTDGDDDVDGGGLFVDVDKDGEAYASLDLEIGSGDSILEGNLITFVLQVPDLSASYQLRFYITDLADHQSNTVATEVD